MKDIKDVGQMIEINVKEFGYNGYHVACLYAPSKVRGKYTVQLFLVQKDQDGDLNSVAFIGTQPEDKILYRQDITSNSGTIKNDLYRIVKYMCTEKIIEEFMEA